MELIAPVVTAILMVKGIRKSLEIAERLPALDWLLSKFWIVSLVFLGLANVPFLSFLSDFYVPFAYLVFLGTVFLLRDFRPALLIGLAILPFGIAFLIKGFFQLLLPSWIESSGDFFGTMETFATFWMFGFGIYALSQNKKERKIRAKQDAERLEIEARKKELEDLVADRTRELSEQKAELETALLELRATQTQLIQSEKLASLGELTAGIAHEIQNPLNFVNNFSELSIELAEDLKTELEKAAPDQSFIKELMHDLSQNQQKINHHGKRAASIVTGMLQHARTSSGKKEPTDLNALADEFLRLSYHGLRAKDSSFNAKMETAFDTKIGKIEVIPQDIGRVFLNLLNNAFYAAAQRKKITNEPFEPTVWVSSRLLLPPSGGLRGAVEIRVRDNGNGIPDDIKAKIFQPFFTTKPTGEGTGLGLSLAYDIVKKGHGGSLEVISEIGKGTEFVIALPLKVMI